MKKTISLLVIVLGWSSMALAQKTLSIDEYARKLSGTLQVQVVDVRTPEEFSEGHLKNASNMDVLNAQFEKNIQTLDKEKPVFVYCLSGGRSSKAMDVLVRRGFKEVYNLDGGYMKWSLAGKPTAGVISANTDEIGIAQFEKTLENNALVLVDYNAKWCGPCKKLLPIVEKLKNDYASVLIVLTIDVDKNKILTKKQGVDALPSLALYKNGQMVWQQIGFTDEASLKAQIEKNK
jgi:thioredoxin 1